PGHFSCGFDHLKHTETFSVAKIEDHLVTLTEGIESEDVRRGKIGNVDIVADAGAIVGGIVVAEYGDVRPLSLRNAQDDGDEVRLWLVGFAQTPRRAGCVEIAKAGVT